MQETTIQTENPTGSLVNQGTPVTRVLNSSITRKLVETDKKLSQRVFSVLAVSAVAVEKQHVALDRYERDTQEFIATRKMANMANQRQKASMDIASASRAITTFAGSRAGDASGPPLSLWVAQFAAEEDTVPLDVLSPLGSVSVKLLDEIAKQPVFRITPRHFPPHQGLALRALQYILPKRAPTKAEIGAGLVGTMAIVAYCSIPAVSIAAASAGTQAAVAAGVLKLGVDGATAVWQLDVVLKLVFTVGVPIGRSMNQLGAGRGLRVVTPEVLRTVLWDSPVLKGYVVAAATAGIGLNPASLVGTISGRLVLTLGISGAVNLTQFVISVYDPSVLTAVAELNAIQVAAKKEANTKALLKWMKKKKPWQEFGKKPTKIRKILALENLKWGVSWAITLNGFQLLKSLGLYAIARYSSDKFESFYGAVSEVAVSAAATKVTNEALLSLSKGLGLFLRYLIAQLAGILLSERGLIRGTWRVLKNEQVAPGVTFEQSFAELFTYLGIPKRLNQPLGDYFSENSSLNRRKSLQVLRNLTFNYVLQTVLSSAGAISLDVFAQRNAEYAEWALQNFSQANMAYTMGVIARGTSDMKTGGDVPINFVDRLFPYLQKATISIGDDLVSNTGKTMYTVTGVEERSTLINVKVAFDGGIRTVDLAKDREFLNGLTVSKMANDYSQQIDINRMIFNDLLAPEDQGGFPLPDTLTPLLKAYETKTGDTTALVNRVLPITEAIQVMEEGKTLLRNAASNYAENFKVLRVETVLKNVFDSQYIGHVDELSPQWQNALTRFEEQFTPDERTKLVSNLFDDKTSQKELEGQLPILSDPGAISSALLEESDRTFARLDKLMRHQQTRLEQARVFGSGVSDDVALQGLVVYTRKYGTSGQAIRAMQTYMSMAQWTGISAQRDLYSLITKQGAAVASAVTTLEKDIQSVIDNRSIGLAPFTFSGFPTKKAVQASLSASEANGFVRQGPGAGAGAGAGEGAVAEAKAEAEAEAEAERDGANLQDIITTRVDMDVRVTEGLKAEVAQILEIGVNQRLGIDAKVAVSIQQAFDVPIGSIVNFGKRLSSQQLDKLIGVKDRVGKLVKEIEKNMPKRPQSCLSTRGWDPVNMVPIDLGEDACFISSIPEKLLSSTSPKAENSFVYSAGLFLNAIINLQGISLMPGIYAAVAAVSGAIISFRFALGYEISTDPHSVYQNVRAYAARKPETLRPEEHKTYMGALLIQAMAGQMLLSVAPENNAPLPASDLGRMYFNGPKRMVSRFTMIDVLAATRSNTLSDETWQAIGAAASGNPAALWSSGSVLLDLINQPEVVGVLMFGGRTSSVAGSYYHKLRDFQITHGYSFSDARGGMDVFRAQVYQDSGYLSDKALFGMPLHLFDTIYTPLSYLSYLLPERKTPTEEEKVQEATI